MNRNPPAETAEALAADIIAGLDLAGMPQDDQVRLFTWIRDLAENRIRTMLSGQETTEDPRCAQCQRKTDAEGRHLENGAVACPREPGQVVSNCTIGGSVTQVSGQP